MLANIDWDVECQKRKDEIIILTKKYFDYEMTKALEICKKKWKTEAPVCLDVIKLLDTLASKCRASCEKWATAVCERMRNRTD